MKIDIGCDFSGKTVKEIIKKHKVSTRLLTRLKSMEDGILVNGERCTVRHVVNDGDVLEIKIDDTKNSDGITPFNAPVDVLWEDEWYAALAKPPHLPTHPARHHQTDTLASRVAFLHKEKSFVFRALTRLDLDTSGVVIIAKNQLAANEFSKMLIAREVKKEYTAVCIGKINTAGGFVDARISRPDKKSITRVAGEVGEESLTEYKVIKTCDNATLVSVFPITGRTHQIRVHMKYIGYPILADSLYSSPSDFIDRQALHASRITFVHPFTKKTISVTCPLFPDMKNCIKNLFGDIDVLE